MLEILDICLRVICFIGLIIVVAIIGQAIACLEINHKNKRWEKRRDEWLRGSHDRAFPDDDK